MDHEGIKIIVDDKGVRTEAYEPLTEEDIVDFGDMVLDELDEDSLEDLLEKAEELQDDLEEEEPEDEDSEEYGLWEEKLSEVADFIDRIRDRLDELEDEEE